MSVEYKLFVIGRAGYKNNVMLEELNKLGAEGWIMVGGTLQEHDYSVGWTAIFYRHPTYKIAPTDTKEAAVNNN